MSVRLARNPRSASSEHAFSFAGIRNQVVATSLLPADARSIGQPLYCAISDADMTTITAVYGSTWPAGDAPLDEVAAAAGSGTHVGIIPREITGEPLTWWVE